MKDKNALKPNSQKTIKVKNIVNTYKQNTTKVYHKHSYRLVGTRTSTP